MHFSSKISLMIASGLVCTLAGAHAPAAPEAVETQPTCQEVAANYAAKYKLMTPQGVTVNPEFARLCVGVHQFHVDAARIGSGPHANAEVFIYMNASAAEAFTSRAATYPVGSVVVKYKEFQPYTDDKGQDGIHGSASGVGGMIKRPAGYAPATGDWEYFYYEPTFANVGMTKMYYGEGMRAVLKE